MRLACDGGVRGLPASSRFYRVKIDLQFCCYWYNEWDSKQEQYIFFCKILYINVIYENISLVC